MKQLYYALQTIIRGKDSSVIKIVSLTLGLFISIILFARVAFELSYDNFYKDADRLFLVNTAWVSDKGAGNSEPYVIYPTAATIAHHFPELVESQTTFSDFAPSVVMHGSRKHKGSFVIADSLYLQTMGLQLLQGNAQDLGTPEAVFLSQSFAREIFGSEDPRGKRLTYPLWGKDYSLTVKGVFADIPENTSLQRTAGIVSMGVMARTGNPRTFSWASGGNYRAFVRLKHKEDVSIINGKINSIIESKYFPKDHYGEMKISGIEVSLSSLLGSHLENANVARMIRIMILLGFALLLTATLNYVLISLSSLSQRAKAVGIHKCNGAGTGSIFGMFLWETAFIIGISLLLITFIILNFSEKIEELTQTSLGGLFSLQNLWAPVSVVLFLFIIGGFLPGLMFSSIPVTQVFKRYTEGKKRWKYPLLFFQFGGAAFLVGIMCVVFTQYQYLLTKDLGYDMKHIAFTYHSFGNTENAVSNLRNLPYVEDAAASGMVMTESRSPQPVKDASGNYLFSPRMNWFSKDFFSFIGLHLKDGHMPTAPGQILVNDAFVKKMGWSSNGVGEVVPEHGTVSGVIEGYYFLDVAEMPPFEIKYEVDETETGCMHVRLKEPVEDNLQRLNTEMKHLYPQNEIFFHSYSNYLESIFNSTRIFRDSTIWACIAILAITLMGLVGYTNDEVRRRSKEIAIRKINGAETHTILRLLSQDITYIAVPAVVLGVLLSWNTGKIWQAQFRDALSISPMLYVGVGVAVLAFIFGSVILKSWRIANENPVNSIKNE